MIDDEQVSKHVLNLNEAWQSGQLDALEGFYHPDVVLLPPDAGAPIIGRDAVVASYREFAEAARLNEFQVTSLDTYPFDDTTICHLRFEIDYEIDRGHFRESGLEVYVVTTGTTQPVIVWRSQAVLETVEILPKKQDDQAPS